MKKTLLVLTLLSALTMGCASEVDHLKKENKPDSRILVQCNDCSDPDVLALQEKVSGISVAFHLAMLEAIGNAADGNRSAGAKGQFDSINYIKDLLDRRGYETKLDRFEFSRWELLHTKAAVIFPSEEELEEGEDFSAMTYSPAGSIIGLLVPVDLDLGPGNQSTSGCEEEDYKDVDVAGKVALVQRGACTFRQKAYWAEYHGAQAIVIFNQGNEPSRTDVVAGTLGESDGTQDVTIPVFGMTYELGAELANAAGAQMDLLVESQIENSYSYNLIAETPGGDPQNVVMLGAHLDSVKAGNGINDNGSGSAGIMEVALNFPDINNLNNKLRFAWWSAEEDGLIGSRRYVERLSNLDGELERIKLYLNFDMIASPNYMLGVFDGDGSTHGLEGPDGSDAIEYRFQNFYASRGFKTVGTEINGRSDYAPFQEKDIPFGGIFTGAEDSKTDLMAREFGGEAGVAFDVCYHEACDGFNNISIDALDINVDAIAYVAVTYSRSVATVTGEAIQQRTAGASLSDGASAKGHDHGIEK